MDPIVALSSSQSIRGPYEGYSICDVVENNNTLCKIDHSRPRSSERFNRLMRGKLPDIDSAPGDDLMYS